MNIIDEKYIKHKEMKKWTLSIEKSPLRMFNVAFGMQDD